MIILISICLLLLPAHTFSDVNEYRRPSTRIQIKALPSITVPLSIGLKTSFSTGVDLGTYLVFVRKSLNQDNLYYNSGYFALKPRFFLTYFTESQAELPGNKIFGSGLEAFIDFKRNQYQWLSASANIITTKETDQLGFLLSAGLAKHIHCRGFEVSYMSLNDFRQVSFSLKFDIGLFVLLRI